MQPGPFALPAIAVSADHGRVVAAGARSCEKVPLVTGEEPIIDIFIRAGCPVCHMIPGIPGANDQVGHGWFLGRQECSGSEIQGMEGMPRRFMTIMTMWSNQCMSQGGSSFLVTRSEPCLPGRVETECLGT